MLPRLIVLGLLFIAAPLQARWHEAQSEHFVIYADDRPEEIQAFAELLESYRAAMELVTGTDLGKLSPSNRLVIYAARNDRQMAQLTRGNRMIAGFYIPRAGFSRAFVADVNVDRGEIDFSTQILLHEYAHHFLMSQSRFAMPRWMNEGAAEFFSSAQFPRSGEVSLGRPNYHRGAELAYADPVPIRELLDEERYDARKRKGYDMFYGRAWLLYHYLFFSEERRGQMPRYGRNIIEGMPALKAAEDAFGDLDKLEKDLNRYARQSRMHHLPLAPDKLGQITRVRVREVSAGHAAVLPLVMRSQRGVDSKEAKAIVTEVRAIAARFPQDAWVHAALAEAEYDAGDDARAIAAADRAIALDPKLVNPYVQKGYAMFRLAGEADDKVAAYKAAMVPFTQLNRLETDHPLPLLYYYRSVVARDAPLTEQARHALERAAQLAPFDESLWFEVGVMQAEEGKLPLAIASLAPIAVSPHGGEQAELASALIAAMKAAPQDRPFDPRPIMTAKADAVAQKGSGGGN